MSVAARCLHALLRLRSISSLMSGSKSDSIASRIETSINGAPIASVTFVNCLGSIMSQSTGCVKCCLQKKHMAEVACSDRCQAGTLLREGLAKIFMV